MQIVNFACFVCFESNLPASQLETTSNLQKKNDNLNDKLYLWNCHLPIHLCLLWQLLGILEHPFQGKIQARNEMKNKK